VSSPRTLVVFHLAELSGPFRDLELGLDWLAEEGSLEVAVPGPGPVVDAFRDVAPVTELPYAAIILPEGPGALGGALRRLVREVRAFRGHLRATRPQVVVLATTTLPSAALAARLERIPTIVYAAEILAGGDGVRMSVAGAAGGRALIALNSRLATAIVACSETAARQFGRGRREVTIAYPPIRDAYGDGDRAGFRDTIGIPADEPCVVAVGNLTRGRGQDVLIRALPEIRSELPSARCAIVGSPLPRRKDLAFAAELPEIARELGVEGAVAFVPSVERIADAYAAADVFVNPVRVPESFGRASCEALVAGRPVVATRVGAIPEVLEDAETALLVPPDDPEALTAAVVKMLLDRDYAERIVGAGRRDILDRFSPDRARAAFKRVISDVTSRSPRPEAQGGARG
jgi:glycosyltransferase involved in cell wall biosynthesis